MGILLKGIAKRLVKSLMQPKVQYNNCNVNNNDDDNNNILLIVIIVVLVLILLHKHNK